MQYSVILNVFAYHKGPEEKGEEETREEIIQTNLNSSYFPCMMYLYSCFQVYHFH